MARKSKLNDQLVLNERKKGKSLKDISLQFDVSVGAIRKSLTRTKEASSKVKLELKEYELDKRDLVEVAISRYNRTLTLATDKLHKVVDSISETEMVDSSLKEKLKIIETFMDVVKGLHPIDRKERGLEDGISDDNLKNFASIIVAGRERYFNGLKNAAIDESIEVSNKSMEEEDAA